MKDLTILFDDKPGALAEVAEVLGRGGVNIEGGCGFPAMGRGIFHILVEDSEKATNILSEAGITVSEVIEVLQIELENIPGNLGTVTRKLADAKINLELFYISAENKIVLGVSDIEKARSLIKF